MAQDQHKPAGGNAEANEMTQPPSRRRRWRGVLLVCAVLVCAVLTLAWLMREDIADDVIAGKLDSLGIPAQYEIVSIGPSQQVIRNLVIGDPQNPDFTAEELHVDTRLRWGLPGIGRIAVVRPRLYGTLHDGRLSFGSLDKVLFGGQGGPFTMPDLDVSVEDGRALIESDYGRIGAKLEGAGALRGGFSGELAAVSPAFSFAGCKADHATLYGKLTTSAQKPSFEGPVRMKGLACPDRAFALADTALQLDVTLDKALDGAQGKIGFRTGAGDYARSRLDGASGTVNFAYRERSLNARYSLVARGMTTPQVRLARMKFDGRARSVDGLARFDIEGDLSGNGIALGSVIDSALSDAEQTGEGTLLAPLAARMRTALRSETRGSALSANLIVRRTAEGISLVVPRGSLKGGSGASLLALSRVQAMWSAEGPPRTSGNFATGGRGLPQISGRMESGGDGRLAMHVEMLEYRSGDNAIAVPRLTLVQASDGALSFTGQAELTGALPGGRTDNLVLPIDGRWSANGALAIWSHCTEIAFDHLRLANLTIDRRKLQVCPASGGAIVQSRGDTLKMAAGVPALKLAGHLGDTPIRITSGPLGFAKAGSAPGVMSARQLNVALGAGDAVSHFTISNLGARIGSDIAGTFDDADISLYAVPLDMRKTAGKWRYAGDVLTIDGASFTLRDREAVARFNPMVARDATLRLADNVITATADIREPESGRVIVRADIVHDLAATAGHADLTVDGLVFDDSLQAGDLSTLMVGFVSNLEGRVDGKGRIDWNAQGVTSHGYVASEGLDLAAPFGPVKGMSGKVVFTDLLGLVSAPDQTIKIAAINPGIEVTDGTLSFALKPDYYLQINGARWPFMGGTLILEPAHMKFGVEETRRYTLKVSGLDAATFVQHLELSNLNATGVFDGELPLIFDENGGRIEEGHLVSRPPGGSVAYVGELTYKDLSAMGNFAFDALKSVEYQQMEISMGGALAGDIITRVSFSGLSQGAGAKQNFLTKQIDKLPIRFVLNIKAPFFSLFAPLRSLYDPAYVTDPRTLGLVDVNGVPLKVEQDDRDGAAIQPSVSETKP